MIKSISHIKNLAVFQDFQWDSSVLDPNGRPTYFKQLNIIYGRNYSGKTTLSRILRSLETGEISEKYINPNFIVTFKDGNIIDEKLPNGHSFTVRVFNEDFVRDNFRVFFEEDRDIAAFAVLGENNTTLLEQIAVKERELGSEETAGTLLAREAECRKNQEIAISNYQKADKDLNDLLRNKASEIKRNTRRYENVTYDIRNIKSDIDEVQKDKYIPLTSEQLIIYEDLLKEITKNKIPACPYLSFQYPTIVSKARELLGKVIRLSQPIQDLLNDAILQEWVRKGRSIHESQRTTCGFCGNILPDNLWDRLGRHFSEESEILRIELQNLVKSIDLEIENLPSFLAFDLDSFYSKFKNYARDLQKNVGEAIKKYSISLEVIKTALEKRLNDIFSPIPIPETDDITSKFQSLQDEYEALRKTANDFTISLKSEQIKARRELRLSEVMTYIRTIDYTEKMNLISQLQSEVDNKKAAIQIATQKTEETRKVIADLKSRIRDERNGAEKVNQYLKHYFGHPSLSLEAVLKENDGGTQYRFEIRRGSDRAHHLSEGERSLLAFCYFMARLEDIETVGKNPIIWIDDPISSLDENHIFFIYSLIRSHIIEKQLYSQLFISTHSLSFLKYLKRVTGELNVQRTYFIIERCNDYSTIKVMPKHIKEYSTEFHYLFQCIYRCAYVDENSDDCIDVLYSFGNNVRKFLEIYLYFRYPDGKDKGQASRLQRFLGKDNVAAALIERIENEYSHLNGLFERGIIPIDISAMKAIAKLILEKIKEYDKDQYIALLDSIGELPDSIGER